MTRKELDELAVQALAGQSSEPAISEPETLPPAEEEPLDDILTKEEIEAIRREAKKKIAEESRKERRQAFMKAALDDARREAGTMPQSEEWKREMDEEVTVYVDLPRLRKVTGGELPPDPIMLDQRVFVAGRTYRVPKRVAIYLQDLMDKARRHVRSVDGRSFTQYDERVGQMIYQGGVAGGGPNGPSFDAIHQRKEMK